MTEKQFEEFLKREARDYHRPPDVPQEDMWAAIQTERHKRHERDRRHGLGAVFTYPAVRWGMGLAATLVLGIGIGLNLDRASLRNGQPVVGAATSVSKATGANIAQQMAAWEHIGRAEAFLTMFRADVRAGRDDYLISSPARDLLNTTRLLQGSRAYDDARFRELFNDLELVLVQIAQLKAEADGIEADLVAEGMEESGVLLKLRAAAPADPALTGIQGVL
jgi:hypothetical protein